VNEVRGVLSMSRPCCLFIGAQLEGNVEADRKLWVLFRSGRGRVIDKGVTA
jgi:hypothetical protein